MRDHFIYVRVQLTNGTPNDRNASCTPSVLTMCQWVAEWSIVYQSVFLCFIRSFVPAGNNWSWRVIMHDFTASISTTPQQTALASSFPFCTLCAICTLCLLGLLHSPWQRQQSTYSFTGVAVFMLSRALRAAAFSVRTVTWFYSLPAFNVISNGDYAIFVWLSFSILPTPHTHEQARTRNLVAVTWF